MPQNETCKMYSMASLDTACLYHYLLQLRYAQNFNFLNSGQFGPRQLWSQQENLFKTVENYMATC